MSLVGIQSVATTLKSLSIPSKVGDKLTLHISNSTYRQILLKRPNQFLYVSSTVGTLCLRPYGQILFTKQMKQTRAPYSNMDKS